MLALACPGLLGAAPSVAAWGDAYVGAFLSAARTENRIVDPSGFGNWGRSGWATDYDAGEVGWGVLAGRKWTLDRVPLRLELDAVGGNMSAQSDRVDPAGRDETVRASVEWAATARLGLEHREGPLTVFINGGMALARITNTLTDIDFAPGVPRYWDPDDSFADAATRIGWVLGIGFETPEVDGWRWRVDGSYLGFGRRTYRVNHSGNNPCGPGGPREPCPYWVENHIVVVRLALIRRFDLWP
ncbi:MAG: hypothetical protein OXF11_05145 [Deltaproteobacteria bacterium]|nr:hypothetical protein [Deltaproteobacteria bacterium]